MISKVFELKRECSNVLDKEHSKRCCLDAVADINQSIRSWVKENLDGLIEDGNKQEFNIKMTVEISDGV